MYVYMYIYTHTYLYTTPENLIPGPKYICIQAYIYIHTYLHMSSSLEGSPPYDLSNFSIALPGLFSDAHLMRFTV